MEKDKTTLINPINEVRIIRRKNESELITKKKRKYELNYLKKNKGDRTSRTKKILVRNINKNQNNKVEQKEIITDKREQMIVATTKEIRIRKVMEIWISRCFSIIMLGGIMKPS